MRVARALRPVAVAALAVVVVSGLFAGDVSAQDVGGQRAKVDRLAAELDRLQRQASDLDEQYLQTDLQLADVQARIKQNQADVADAQARMDQARREANSYVVSAYMGAGSGLDVAPGTGDPNQAINQKVLLETLQGDRQQVADDLRAARLDLNDKTAELDASTKELSAKRDRQRSIKADLEASVAKQQDLLRGANAELQAAVQAEQARRAAEAAAKAKAAEQAREAAAAKAAQARSARATTSTVRAGATTSTTARASRGATRVPTSSVAAPTAVPAAVPIPVSAPNGGASAAIAAARSVLGTPYRWAGSTPAGFDCSGLTMWAWAHGGVSLPHSSASQYAMTQHIPVSQLQPGDLVFYGSSIHHVGLYIGGGQMIDSPHTGAVVRVISIYGMGETPKGGRLR